MFPDGSLQTSAAPAARQPQGRLTLTTGKPVMIADSSGATIIYYDCYLGNAVPVYNGADSGYLKIAACQIALTLNASQQLSGNLYDIFAINASGVLTLCAGPAWSSATSRGTGAGTTQIHNTVTGYWTNQNALTTCYAGTTNYGSIPVDRATYLGTLYATANGQTSMQLKPTAINGGTNNFAGLYNAYNRVPTIIMCKDNTAAYGLSSANTWLAADTSTSNRITFVDGLQQSPLDGTFQTTIDTISSYSHSIGINLDSTTAAPVVASTGNNTGGSWFQITLNVADNFYPQLGLHYLQAMEFYMTGSNFQPRNSGVATGFQLKLRIDM